MSRKRQNESGKRFIAAVDFGTTSVRCLLYDFKGNVKSMAVDKIDQIYPRQGWFEIDPELVWSKFLSVFKQALENIEANASEISAFGLATQRGSFVTWDRRTGKPFHNFITWKDLRADHLVRTWNNSWTVAGVRIGSKLLHFVTRKKRYFAGTAFKFMNVLVSLRLKWILNHNEQLRRAAEGGDAALGTLDTYILHRLTLGRLHATDYSNVCVTGLFDPYTCEWADWMINMLDIPKSLLPEVKDSVGNWGNINKEILGAEIPIRCVVSDQGASLFGSCCFQPGDVRLSMGTGSFLSFNTGSKPHASVEGLFPVIGWKIGPEITYFAEGISNDTGTVMEWCREIGLFEKFDDISSIVSSVANSGDVYFIPAFSGIQAPVNDELAATGFIGLKPSTTKQHLLRSAVESLVFRVVQMCRLMSCETGHVFQKLKVGGGVTRNDFAMQLVSDLVNAVIERPSSIETASDGAAFMAGLAAGVWRSRDEFLNIQKTERTFHPDNDRWLDYAPVYSTWEKAIERLAHWY